MRPPDLLLLSRPHGVITSISAPSTPARVPPVKVNVSFHHPEPQETWNGSSNYARGPLSELSSALKTRSDKQPPRRGGIKSKIAVLKTLSTTSQRGLAGGSLWETDRGAAADAGILRLLPFTCDGIIPNYRWDMETRKTQAGRWSHGSGSFQLTYFRF